MEYISDIKPELRGTVDYELTVVYDHHPDDSSKELSVDDLVAYVVKTVGSCRSMFRILSVESGWRTIGINTNRFFCVIGLSAAMSPDNAVPYMLMLNIGLYDIVQRCWYCTVMLRCMATGLRILMSSENSDRKYVCSADTTMLKWSIINGKHEEILKRMDMKEKASMFCRLLGMVRDEKWSFDQSSLCGMTDIFAAQYLNDCGYISVDSLGDVMFYYNSYKRSRNVDIIKFVVCYMHDYSVYDSSQRRYVVLFAGTDYHTYGDNDEYISISMIGKVIEIVDSIESAVYEITLITGVSRATAYSCIEQAYERALKNEKYGI